MHPNEQLIHQFYTAFQNKDFRTMQNAYHPKGKFSDPVFQNLSSEEVQAMWQMLITSGSDLKLIFNKVQANDSKGSAHWEAWYTFSGSGRKVHNIIDANFEFKDGKIYWHRDHFYFWRWSKMALGTSGLLLGWSSFLRKKVRRTANSRLLKFIAKNQMTSTISGG
jgi:hypothetical protein